MSSDPLFQGMTRPAMLAGPRLSASAANWTAFGVPFAVAFPVESPTVKTMAKHRDALEAALGEGG